MTVPRTIRRSLVTAALAVLALLCPLDAVLAGDGYYSAAKRKHRADNDVRVELKVRGKRKDRLRVEVKVKNRGRLDQSNLEVVLHDGDAANPIWSNVISLDSGKRKKFRLRFDREDVGDLLTAECRGPHDDDENPDDNDDSEPVAPDPPREPSAAERGRDIYVPLCSGCHGADGRGGSVEDENIARESWDEFVEAFREGEDGMPTYPNLTSRDARDIVAYLRNPDSVAPPTPPTEPPPVDPPPPGTTPTYTQNVKSILDARCVSCHGSGFAAAGIALHTYSTASQNATATLASVVAGRMPTSGSLSTADIQTIRDWIDGGKPE